jgi:hypothetical protein
MTRFRMKRGMVDTGGCYAEPMAKRPDLTAYQRKIVDRYYEHNETIHATKLGELVSEIALTSDAKKLDKLWKSASEYLAKCGVELAIVRRHWHAPWRAVPTSTISEERRV